MHIHSMQNLPNGVCIVVVPSFPVRSTAKPGYANIVYARTHRSMCIHRYACIDSSARIPALDQTMTTAGMLMHDFMLLYAPVLVRKHGLNALNLVVVRLSTPTTLSRWLWGPWKGIAFS